MRHLLWLAGAIITSTALYILFGRSIIFTLVGAVAVARAVLIFFAIFREEKVYHELQTLSAEERRQLLESAGQQGLVKRSPPTSDE